MPKIILLIFLLLNILLAAQADLKSDFLLVKDPANLTIYNKYQQSMGFNAKSELGEYVPFQIVESFGTFSDGLRNFIKVETGGTEYYLLAEKENKPVITETASKTFLLKNKTIIKDSISILLDNKLTLRVPDSQQKVYLSAGDRLTRIFRDVTEVYVYSERMGKFGWVRFPEGLHDVAWEKQRSGQIVASVGYNEIINRIREKTEEYNKVILAFFTHLNKKTDKNLAMPYWAIDEQGSYTFIKFVDHQESFSESVKGMLEEIRKIVSISNLKYESIDKGVRITLN